MILPPTSKPADPLPEALPMVHGPILTVTVFFRLRKRSLLLFLDPEPGWAFQDCGSRAAASCFGGESIGGLRGFPDHGDMTPIAKLSNAD